MRFERALRCGWVLIVAQAMTGCVSTGENSNSLDKNLPRVSKSEQAKEAARVHTELGQRYLDSGDLQTALQKLTLAIQFDPNYVPAHTVIALVYERINDLPQAELHYRKAQQLEPTKGDTNNNLGVFLCHTNKYAESTAYFQKAVADPFYGTPDVALVNEGVCQLRANNAPAAEKNFRDAIARNSNNGEALFQLAGVLYKQNDAFRARAFIQRFDALGSPTPASLKLGYDIESRLGNTDAAHTYSQRLQSQFPDSEQAHALNGIVSP